MHLRPQSHQGSAEGARRHAPHRRQDPASAWSSQVRSTWFYLKVAISVGRVTSGKTMSWAQHPPGWASPPRGEDELQRWVPASGGLAASGPPALGRPGGPSKGVTHHSGFLRFPSSHPPDRFALWRPGQVIHGALEGSRWAVSVVSGSGQRWHSRTQQQQQPPSPSRGGGPRCDSQMHLLLFQITFYILVKAVYTLGYSASLISLTTGSIILCLFR